MCPKPYRTSPPGPRTRRIRSLCLSLRQAACTKQTRLATLPFGGSYGPCLARCAATRAPISSWPGRRCAALNLFVWYGLCAEAWCGTPRRGGSVCSFLCRLSGARGWDFVRLVGYSRTVSLFTQNGGLRPCFRHTVLPFLRCFRSFFGPDHSFVLFAYSCCLLSPKKKARGRVTSSAPERRHPGSRRRHYNPNTVIGGGGCGRACPTGVERRPAGVAGAGARAGPIVLSGAAAVPPRRGGRRLGRDQSGE